MNAGLTAALLLALLAGIIRAEDKCFDSVVIYARCPGTCLTGPDALATVFDECANLEQFGCKLRTCSGTSGFSCVQGPIPPHVEVCPGQKLLFPSVKVSDPIQFFMDLNNILPLETDLYLLSDATGSMSTAISTAKNKFNDIVNVFKGRTNIAFGVGIFRDEVELDDGFENLQSLTTSIPRAQAAINKIHARGGLDSPEANLVALYKIATEDKIRWRARSRKILVYFGDNPGHEASCFDGITMTREKAIAALKVKGITVIAVSFLSSGPGLDAPTRSYRCGKVTSTRAGQATDITKATNGKLVPSTDQGNLVNAITGALANLPKTFQVDTSDCDDKVAVEFNPTLPLTLAPRQSKTVKQTIWVKDRVCKVGGRFTCQYKYKESGADLPPTDVEVLDVIGCPGFTR